MTNQIACFQFLFIHDMIGYPKEVIALKDKKPNLLMIGIVIGIILVVFKTL